VETGAHSEKCVFHSLSGVCYTFLRKNRSTPYVSGSRVVRLGPYEILVSVGAGGMGEVYRAKKNKRKREVAPKVVPDSTSGDPERIARFQLEADVLATLIHPNIAAMHGVPRPPASRDRLVVPYWTTMLTAGPAIQAAVTRTVATPFCVSGGT
jgi:serine/threonine protein kinase